MDAEGLTLAALAVAACLGISACDAGGTPPPASPSPSTTPIALPALEPATGEVVVVGEVTGSGPMTLPTVTVPRGATLSYVCEGPGSIDIRYGTESVGGGCPSPPVVTEQEMGVTGRVAISVDAPPEIRWRLLVVRP